MAKTSVVSWNVNGIRSVLKKGFLDWVNQAQPDVLCLQESRAMPSDIKDEEREPSGYTSIWTPAQKKGYAGVATYTKTEPLSVSNGGQLLRHPPEQFDTPAESLSKM